MMIRTSIVVSATLASPTLAAQADAALVIAGGQWEIRTGEVAYKICQPTDRELDATTLVKMTAVSGPRCNAVNVKTIGRSVTYETRCKVAGGQMTIRGKLTTQGSDAYTNRTHSHFEGGPIEMPDMQITEVARRLGPCQPNDVKSPF
jgi:hypothetical protein